MRSADNRALLQPGSKEGSFNVDTVFDRIGLGKGLPKVTLGLLMIALPRAAAFRFRSSGP